MSFSHSWREIAKVLHAQARPTPEYFVLCVVASIIATFGLLMNNATAIVGAILIAPLMGPMLGISFSSLTGRGKSARQAAFTLCAGIGLILVVSYVISLFFLNVGITSEMLSRAKPTLLNLLIAFPAGFLAGYTRIRKSLSDKVYGVAMSVTTLPPLCIMGIALAQQQFPLFKGSALMFISNFMGIMFSSFIAFASSEFKRIRTKHLNRLAFPGILLLMLTIPLSITFFEVSQTQRLKETLNMALNKDQELFAHMEVTDMDINIFDSPITAAITLRISADSVHSGIVKLSPQQSIQKRIDDIQASVTQHFGSPVQLTVHTLPVNTFHGSKTAIKL